MTPIDRYTVQQVKSPRGHMTYYACTDNLLGYSFKIEINPKAKEIDKVAVPILKRKDSA